MYTTAEIGLYGIVRLEGTEDAYLLGPVFGVDVTEETVLAFMRDVYKRQLLYRYTDL